MAENNTQQSGKYIALGIAFGAALGVAFNQVAIGIAFGLISTTLFTAYRSRRSNQDPDSYDNK
ncbi:hypothetical protein F909_01220 [Acinetobacter sp. ANC 3929]|uniref:hypothetical protein n=1 Tax=unclassified Acinetobacter TaxID=196816 RepID=UPI0002D049DF|nr:MULTISPECIES: hypothetical protein [unclassified Acinetobacter]ENW82943.1 hypothetical protein F909_01220 [Acinetobacter sp. ANC 3929]MCH7350635.1 hypothetical protein [Acinetobacter sp. NIPH 2023]MCH7355273.1 hypothetical protein [Acinetobacter sp. NIPH 1958]MCH7357725.1 hypothetical protein [Acinetobacter sp. NIPH 2024]